MNQRRLQTGILLGLFILSIFSVLQFASAASRKELLEEFCLNNQHEDGAFMDTNNESAEVFSEFSTYSNLHILSLIDSELDNILDADKEKTIEWVSTELDVFLDVETQTSKSLRDGYYAYFSLALLEETVNDTLTEEMTDVIIAFQDEETHGFKSNASVVASLAETYYAVQFLTNTEYMLLNITDGLVDFVMSCWNEEMNLFSSIPGGDGSLIDTFYGIQILENLNQLTNINTANRTAIANTIETYYCDNPSFVNHYGGYSYSQIDSQSSIFQSYIATEILTLLELETHAETFDWILDRQSSYDYGFQDPSTSGVRGASSAKLSYYAVNIILEYEPTAFENSRGAAMNEELWELTTSGWIIAGIVLLILAIIAGIGYGIYRYKTKI